jgi:hypothetical protein
VRRCDHEPMVLGGGLRSVSFLIFALSFPTHPPVPLVPPFVSSQPTRSMRPTEHSMSSDPPLACVSILSRLPSYSLHINHTTRLHLPSFQ